MRKMSYSNFKFVQINMKHLLCIVLFTYYVNELLELNLSEINLSDVQNKINTNHNRWRILHECSCFIEFIKQVKEKM